MAWIEINRLNINSTYPKPPTRTYSFSASKVFIRFIFESLLGFGVHYKTLWLWAHQASRNFCTAVWASGEWHYMTLYSTGQNMSNSHLTNLASWMRSSMWRFQCQPWIHSKQVVISVRIYENLITSWEQQPFNNHVATAADTVKVRYRKTC